jgi:hypothetical protein
MDGQAARGCELPDFDYWDEDELPDYDDDRLHRPQAGEVIERRNVEPQEAK